MDVIEIDDPIATCPTFVSEIFLAFKDFIVSTLLVVSDNDISYTKEERICQHIDVRITQNHFTGLRGDLLTNYWSWIKENKNDIDLITCFQKLISYYGYKPQDNISIGCHDAIGFPSPSRSISLEPSMFEMMKKKFESDLQELHKELDKHRQNFQKLEKLLDEVYQLCENHQSLLTLIEEGRFTEENCRQTYKQKRQGVLMGFDCIQKNMKDIIRNVFTCIKTWKISHYHAYVKVGHELQLDTLEECCSLACKLLIDILRFLEGDKLQNIKMCQDIFHSSLTPEIFNFDIWKRDLKSALEELFKRSFVVIKQPTDVQKVTGPGADKAENKEGGKGKGKKGTKKAKSPAGENSKEKENTPKNGPEFEMKVKILCGGGVDCIQTVTRLVTARFCYEGDLIAETVMTSGDVHGTLSVPRVTIDQTGMAFFKKQKIKNHIRPNKTGKNERVGCERYRIEFSTEITMQHPEVRVILKTISLPIAIITGSSQASTAHGALLWYIYNNNPYDLQTPQLNCIKKQQVIDMIQARFSYLEGRCLRDDEIDFLINQKLLKNKDQEFVSFEDFTEKRETDDGFWKWLQSVLNLLEFYLKKPWKDGIIHGFVSKATVNQLLENQLAGTFILRFSETTVKGDGQNRNLTGALVVGFSLGPDEQGNSRPAMFSRPLTVEKYFKNYSFGKILKSIKTQESYEPVLKKLYCNELTIEDIVKTYSHADVNIDKKNENYPHCQEQVIMLIECKSKLADLKLDDVTETDIFPVGKVQKYSEDSSESYLMGETSQSSVATQPFINPEAANELLYGFPQHDSGNIFDLTSFQPANPNIPTIATDMLSDQSSLVTTSALMTSLSPVPLNTCVTTSTSSGDQFYLFDNNNP